MGKKVVSWCGKNAMLTVALSAAGLTALFVPPDREYLGYYDIKTLVCLFSVLAVVFALRDAELFSVLSQRLVRTFHTDVYKRQGLGVPLIPVHHVRGHISANYITHPDLEPP